MRIGILGGTFDPIHMGHLVCAQEALEQFDLDKIVFMVAGKPAFKEGSSVASAQDRYWMTCLATADNPLFEVSTAELDRIGTTYTIDTLRDIHKDLDDEDELFFIMGADAMGDLPLWKDASLVGDYAHFIVATRPGHELTELKEELTQRLPQLECSFMKIPALDLSSSELRERFLHGKTNRYLMGEEASHYAIERELYA
jgi:nicotinate-nucleotide adenylyltransferase